MKTKLRNSLLIAGIFMVTFLGCKETDSKKDQVTKKWSYVEFKMEDQILSGEQLGKPTMEFKEDGTYIVEFGAMSENGTWKLEENKLITSSTTTDVTNTLIIMELTEEKLILEGDSEGSKVLITLAAVKTPG